MRLQRRELNYPQFEVAQIPASSVENGNANSMKLDYTILYVPDVATSLSFFEKAFGLSRRFLHESGDYGELATGETTLAFASLALGLANFPAGFVAASES